MSTTKKAKLRRCAESTGSLPVSSVLYLIERWGKNAGQWKSDVEYHKRPIFKDDPAAAISVASCEARASIYAVCIQDLRAEMACANLRQPEENGCGEPRPGGSA